MQQPNQPGYPGQYPGQYPGVQPATHPGGQPSVYPGYQAGAPPPGAPPAQGYGSQNPNYPPQQGGYPPQQGGYPPQQGGYPPQQGGYPPQQGGYPPPAGGAPAYPPQAGAPPPQGAPGYPPPAQGGQQQGVDAPTYKGDVPDEDVEVDPNAAQAQQSSAPSAPPAEKMDQVAGYDHMNAPVPPPSSYQEAMSNQQPPQREAVSSTPNITEEQAREALAQFVSENCCYGSKAAREMVFIDITHSRAFHYKLETFTEKRSTNWASEPFRGQAIDGPQNGPAPGPWDIQVQVPAMFQNNKSQAEVPHTASVKPCHECHGVGRKRCHVCLGRGRTRCHHCHGSGRTMVHDIHHHDDHGSHHGGGHHYSHDDHGGHHGGGHHYAHDDHGGHHGGGHHYAHDDHGGYHGGGHHYAHDDHGGHHGGGHHYTHDDHGGHHGGGHHYAPCTWCDGLGYNRCHKCFGHGQIKCGTCDGTANLKFYIRLYIDWINHIKDNIVERTSLPDELIKGVTGEVAFKEEQPRVWPINHFPDQQINQASNQLVNEHVSAFRMEKIVMQRHQVRIVPVAQAHYKWKGDDGNYFVYGFEHKVHAPDYPQQCCCGCTIL